MPSWGSLLKELEGLVSVGEEPWKFVPLILLVVVVTSFQHLLSRQEEVAARSATRESRTQWQIRAGKRWRLHSFASAAFLVKR